MKPQCNIFIPNTAQVLFSELKTLFGASRRQRWRRRWRKGMLKCENAAGGRLNAVGSCVLINVKFPKDMMFFRQHLTLAAATGCFVLKTKNIGGEILTRELESMLSAHAERILVNLLAPSVQQLKNVLWKKKSFSCCGGSSTCVCLKTTGFFQWQ